MNVYLDENVFEAGLRRIGWLFDEFENVVVSMSGGKDSTVCFHLALMVAEQRDRLPLKVMWIDQEAEWEATVDYMREVMHDPRVEPYWMQVPFKESNATSSSEDWLFNWEPGVKWMRDKEPDSIHDNVYGTDRFGELFAAFSRTHFPGQPVARIGGVRTEESPGRRLGLTSGHTYKGVTWGKVDDYKVGQYVFYPIYDWRLADVWHAIEVEGWPYNRVYDLLYQHGGAPWKMRVSNLHHEGAMTELLKVQEIEPDTWDRFSERLYGVNTANHLQWAAFRPKTLPFMFRDWREYRDHLLENLVVPDTREVMRQQFARCEEAYDFDTWPKLETKLIKAEIRAILTNDTFMETLGVFQAAHLNYTKRRGNRSGLKVSHEQLAGK